MGFRGHLIAGFIAAVLIFLYARAGPRWINEWGIDPATYVFLAFIPLLILLRLSSAVNGFLAIVFILFSAFFSLNKYEKSAENLAIIALFLFTISVFQSIYELYSSNR